MSASPSDPARPVKSARARACLVEAQVQPHVLGQLMADGPDRIQRRHRLLKHHGDLRAPYAPQRLWLQRQHVDVFEANGSRGDTYRW